MRKKGLPLEGKAIRFAAERGGKPAASFWKVWCEGSEIYALARNFVGQLKISIHGSGQIHLRLGPKHKQDLAPLMRLGLGPWFHALEIKFLLSEGAKTPTKEGKSLKNKSAYLISVPDGFFLVANIVVGVHGTSLDHALPIEFGGAQILWRTCLRDGRPAILLARILPLDSQNREQIKQIREELKPTANFSSEPRESYVEIHHVHWSEGGNIVAVIPMGDEAIRIDSDASRPTNTIPDIREFQYRSARHSADIVAPNGLRAAVLEFDDVDKAIPLAKGVPNTCVVGSLTMRLDSGNLIAGSGFLATPCKVACVPSIGGGKPRHWEYIIFARFDGFSLSAELRQQSTSLRNKNLGVAIEQLGEREELVMAIPYEMTKLVATLDVPSTSREIQGRFTLRDVR
jgi:hypothetical protein